MARRRAWTRSALALLLATASVSAGAQRNRTSGGSPNAARITPSQLRAFGLAALQQQIAKYGRLNDAAAEARVVRLMNRLIAATGHPGLTVEFAIIRDSSVNAAMFPGAVMFVNAGLLTKITEWTREEAPSDQALQTRRYDAHLAAVLAHELAHATLGHPDSALVAAVRAKASLRSAEDLETQVREALANPELMQERLRMRGDELSADRVGSLYLLRSGWEIQDAMNLMRLFDAWERTVSRSTVSTLSWFTDHPRSSAREAALEGFRASLKLHQAEFDDAVVLLRNNVMLDSAEALLGRVLADFPYLLAAIHARAAVQHRRWLNATPVQQLVARSSVPTYDARFIEGIRGSAASPLLDAARQGYRDVLARELLPYALSNLAVLDAYAGELRVAEARADSAARMAADDPQVLNNRGVVLLLARKPAPARDVFRELTRRHPDWIVPLFNLGRASLSLGDSAGARDAFSRYVEADAESEWATEAGRALQRLGAGRVAAAGRAPAPTGGSMPSVGSVTLGETRAQAAAKLGTPTQRRTSAEGEVWGYPERGLAVGIAADGSVAFVLLQTRAAGDVEGVRVGDTLASARQRWGKAVEDIDGIAVFSRGAWNAMVWYQGQEIMAVGAERKR